jgi:mRNA-degrading endonuclease YafQ of YafQ-DinJ toxin-antitoxin module
MPTLILSHSFKIDLKNLELIEKKQAVKALRLLEANPKHPSLQIHRVNGMSHWEVYVNKDIRIIFEQNSDTLILIAIGHHDILKKH